MSKTARRMMSPLPYLGKLTLSAGVITDVTRLAGVEGDGEAYPASMAGVWPAATNLVTNGGFETNTTGWVAFGGAGATIERTTSMSKFGSACLKVTLGGSVAYDGAAIGSLALTNGTVYTASAWVRCETGTMGLRIRVVNTSSVSIGQTAFTATTSWQRVSVTVTATADTPFAINVLNNTGGVSTAVFYVDGVSCYASAIDMPYIETDGGTASRVAGTITMPASVLDETQMWVAGRLNLPWAAEPVTDPGVFTWADSASERLEVHLDTTGTQRFFIKRDSGGSSVSQGSTATTWSAGDDVSFAGAFTSGSLKISNNGLAFAVNSSTQYIPALSATTARLGDRNTVAANRLLHGRFRWFAAGKGTLTDADAARFHSWGNNDPLPHMFPPSAQLTFLAKFDGDGTAYRHTA